jgi:predicted transcriptional regulator
MKTMNIGYMPPKLAKQYTLQIACGKIKPKAGDPKIWFDSIESAAQVLGTKNQELLRLIDTKKPRSLEELAKFSGRKKGNLSRTLKKLAFYGIVEFKQDGRRKVPTAKAVNFNFIDGKTVFKRQPVLKKESMEDCPGSNLVPAMA